MFFCDVRCNPCDDNHTFSEIYFHNFLKSVFVFVIVGDVDGVVHSLQQGNDVCATASLKKGDEDSYVTNEQDIIKVVVKYQDIQNDSSGPVPSLSSSTATSKII